VKPRAEVSLALTALIIAAATPVPKFATRDPVPSGRLITAFDPSDSLGGLAAETNAWAEVLVLTIMFEVFPAAVAAVAAAMISATMAFVCVCVITGGAPNGWLGGIPKFCVS